MRPLRVLFVNHTGSFSGAEAAMLRLLHALPERLERAVACPAEGPLADAVTRAGFLLLPIPGTALSFRLDPRTTAVDLRDLARSVAAVAARARRWRADVVHANGTRAGLIAVAPPSALRAPTVVQVHDILPPSRMGRAVRQTLATRADGVIAVSAAATDAFNRGAVGSARTINISIDHARFRPDGHDRDATRRSLGVPLDAPLLVEVAQITPWKGQLVAIEALAEIRRTHPAASLVLVGQVAFSGPSVRYDNHGYDRRLRERVRELDLEGAVLFAGFRDDVPEVMAAADLMLLPSWEEPFGTVVVETMACGTVPLVTDEGGPSEIVEDGVTGRVLPPREPAAYARAAVELLNDDARRAAMAQAAVSAAARYTDRRYADACAAVYSQVAAR